MAGQQDHRSARHEPVQDRLVASQRHMLAPVCEMDFPRSVQDLHQHHAEVQVNSADNAISPGIVILVADRQAEILDANHAVTPVDRVNHPRHESRECVRLLDREHLRERHDQTNSKIDQVIKPGPANFVAGHEGHSVDRGERPGVAGGLQEAC